MDYEKAHKQTLERAKGIIDKKGYDLKNVTNTCETIFSEDLTNEEKARILSNIEYLTADDYAQYPSDDTIRRINTYRATLEMAAWKEEQVVEKAVNWLKNNATDHIGFDSIYESFSLSWDFIDLFKQAMEE